ncbi:MAG: Uma2 family endonuclease, partial [Candidatus Xenobia bacterium]
MLQEYDDIEYPSSDGLPMTDQDLNRFLMEYVDLALRNFFARDPQVYVSADLFIYYKPGDKRRRVAPDVFVVRGVPNHPRQKYLLWKENVAPQAVFEFMSDSSMHVDPLSKVTLYEDIGVQEYYVFDGTAEQLMTPRLRAWRRQGRYLVEIPVGDAVESPVLGVRLRVEGTFLRLYDTQTGEALPTNPELWQRLQDALSSQAEAVRRAQEEAERADEEARRAD